MQSNVEKLLQQLANEIQKDVMEDFIDSAQFDAGVKTLLQKLDKKYGEKTTTFFAIEMLAQLVQQQRIDAHALFYPSNATPGTDPVANVKLTSEQYRGDDGEERNWLFGEEKVFGHDLAFNFNYPYDRP